jgi:integrase/recombinase XerD
MKIHKGRNEKTKMCLLDKDLFKNHSENISKINYNFIKTISLQDMHSYLKFCKDILKNQESSRRTKVENIQSYYHYLYKIEKKLEINIADDLEAPSVTKDEEPIYLTSEECQRLIKSVKDDKNNINQKRNLCIITLFLHSAIRISELLNLNLNNLVLTGRYPMMSILHGKGDKRRNIDLDDESIDVINEWLSERNKIDMSRVKIEDRDALFISSCYKRLSTSMVANVVSKYIKLSGLENKGITPHKLRHSCLTMLYEAGVDIVELQEIAGHSNINTTKIYTHLSNDKRRNAIRKNPLNNYI